MECFTTSFILDEMQGFLPKEGMSCVTHFPHDSNSESFLWPIELHILSHYGAVNVLELIYPEIKPPIP